MPRVLLTDIPEHISRAAEARRAAWTWTRAVPRQENCAGSRSGQLLTTRLTGSNGSRADRSALRKRPRTSATRVAEPWARSGTPSICGPAARSASTRNELRHERQRRHVVWSHDAEVPVIQRDEPRDAEALGDCHEAGVGRAQRQIRVPLHEISSSVKISDRRVDDCQGTRCRRSVERPRRPTRRRHGQVGRPPPRSRRTAPGAARERRHWRRGQRPCGWRRPPAGRYPPGSSTAGDSATENLAGARGQVRRPVEAREERRHGGCCVRDASAPSTRAT